VRSARHIATLVAESLGCTPVVGLVVSELASNAWQHAQTPFEVSGVGRAGLLGACTLTTLCPPSPWRLQAQWGELHQSAWLW
jgi:hypothetical protein